MLLGRIQLEPRSWDVKQLTSTRGRYRRPGPKPASFDRPRPLPNLHPRALRLRESSVFRLEAAMHLKQSDAPASVRLSSQRKWELLDYFDSSGGEQYRGGRVNASYREDDRKFMRFLIPPGKRVLELGCGRGDLLAALEPSYGVGIDFSAGTLAKANALHPGLHFVFGDAEEPDTLASIEGPFDYIVLADT